MRSVIVVVVGLLVSTAHADPFSTRNPVPGAAASPAPAPEPTTVVIDRGKTQRRAGMFTAFGGVALLGGSLAVSLYASSRYHAATDRLDNGSGRPGDADEANHWAGVARVYGTSLFLAGAVATGIGTYLYFSAPERVRIERVAIVPAVGGDSVGLTVSGGF